MISGRPFVGALVLGRVAIGSAILIRPELLVRSANPASASDLDGEAIVAARMLAVRELLTGVLTSSARYRRGALGVGLAADLTDAALSARAPHPTGGDLLLAAAFSTLGVLALVDDNARSRRAAGPSDV